MHDLILTARENRAKEIEKWLHQGNEAVLSIRANMPTSIKNSSEAYVIVRFFECQVKEKFNVIKHERFESADGPYTLCSIKHERMAQLKRELMSLEDNLSIGRLVDLDLWSIPDQLWSRSALGEKPRTCYLCAKPAHQCVRSQEHDINDVINYIKKTVYDHLRSEVYAIAQKAITQELRLEHKFGLVTPTSMGSHKDMDYTLMMKSHEIILPYFVDIFRLGYEKAELYHLLELARPLGIQTEKNMMQVTGGINTYKGLIFILGLVCLSLGYTMNHHQDFNHIFQNIHHLSQNILSDFEKKPKTFGEKAYREHQILGARGEAYLGLPSVHHALNLMSNATISDALLRRVLQQLIRTTDDTVLLKRAGSFENYMHIKKMVASIQVDNLEEVKSFTAYAIENHLSFGGAADLLIATIFLYEIKKRYY